MLVCNQKSCNLWSEGRGIGVEVAGVCGEGVRTRNKTIAHDYSKENAEDNVHVTV